MRINELLEHRTTLGVDLVDLLGEMGLSEKEADIYDFLLSCGGATPSAIARHTGLPRGRIYEGMRNLVAKGFARERPTRPILFLATPLSEVLTAAQSRLMRHLQVVRRAQAYPLAHQPGAPTGPPVPVRMRDVRVLAGRRACYAEVSRMATAASRFFWLSGSESFARRLTNMPALLEAIGAAAARGVDVRILVAGTEPLGRALALLAASHDRPILHRVERRESALVLCANESASLEVLAQPDDDAPGRGDDVAIQIEARVFADEVRQRMEPPAPAAAAPPFAWLGPDHGSDLFAGAIEAATDHVHVLGPPEWGAHMRATWARQSPTHQAAVRRGVALRVVATDDAVAVADLATLQGSWDVRIAPHLPMWLTIVDGRELFQAFPHPSLGGVPQFRRSAEPHEVRFYQAIFDRLWAGAPSPAPRGTTDPPVVGSWPTSEADPAPAHASVVHGPRRERPTPS